MRKRSIRIIVSVMVVIMAFSVFPTFVPQTSREVHASGEEEFWYSLSSNYYYSCLSSREKDVYDALDRFCMSVLLSDDDYELNNFVPVDIYGFTMEDLPILDKVCEIFITSNPQYFFLAGNSIYEEGDSLYESMHMRPVYQDGEARVQAREEIRNEILRYENLISPNLRPEEKERIVHDLMIENIVYDHNLRDKPEYEFGQAMIDSAVRGGTVCRGFALWFEAVMNHLDFLCVYVGSDSHGWNAIYLHGCWYYVDVTWDNNNDEYIVYTFYNCNSETLSNYDVYDIDIYYSDIVPDVVFDGFDQWSTMNEYSPRYFDEEGFTFFIESDDPDGYGLNAFCLEGSGSGYVPSYVEHDGKRYRVTNAGMYFITPSTDTFFWRNESFNNVDSIQYECVPPEVVDTTSMYYKVSYEGDIVYTSDMNDYSGCYSVDFPDAPCVTGADGTVLAAGSYSIVFFDGHRYIGGDVCTVTADIPEQTGDDSSDAVSSSPAPAVTTTPVPSVNEPGVSGFVERLYTIALGRSSDLAGKLDWIDAITVRGESGADCARGFLFSPEFLGKQCSNEEFVATLYRTFFNREPDQAGFDAWVNALNNGASKQEIIEGFINSTEWANLCVSYGIRSGSTAVPTTDFEPNAGSVDFATRLYTTCLGRAADQEGLMAWARQLTNQRDTGSGAARGFFFSSEFIGQNVSNGEYVTRLYRTFMGREPDQAGYDAWVAQLDQGVSKEEVFNGFAGSVEFARICSNYGIIK